MSNTFLFADNARTTLGSALSSGSTTIVVAAGAGALFPSPAAGQQFAVTLNDVATGLVYEVCYCAARSGDSLTVVRGQEGTAATSWSVGDRIWCGPTSGQMAAMVQTPAMTNGSISPVFSTDTANSGFISAGYDAGGFNFRAVNLNYGAGLRNDGSNVYLLQTASASQYGSFNSYRPFAWNLSTGAVTIDATGAGITTGGGISATGAITAASGNVTAANGALVGQTGVAANSGNIQAYAGQVVASTGLSTSAGGVMANAGNIVANTGRVRAGVGARGSGDGNACTILNDFSLSVPAGGVFVYTLPSGFIIQMSQVVVNLTAPGPQQYVFTLPVAFPNSFIQCLAAIYGTLPQTTYCVGGNPYSNSQVEISIAGSYTNINIAVAYVAFGY